MSRRRQSLAANDAISGINSIRAVILLIGTAFMQLPLPCPATAAERSWQTRPYSLVCPSYFSMTDGEAATIRRDDGWLKETQCLVIQVLIELTILQDPPLTSTNIWRIRLHVPNGGGATVYIRPYNVMGWAADGVGPLAYNEVFRRDAELSRRSEPEARNADPKAFGKLLKNLEDKRPEPAAFDNLLKSMTRQQVVQADGTPPAPPSSQPKAPLGARLTASDIDLMRAQLIPCFNPPFGAKEKPDLVADIRVVMNRDGTVQQARVADQGQYAGDPIYRAIADSGIRALKNPQCSPLRLPPDRYDLWQTFVFGFSIRDMQ